MSNCPICLDENPDMVLENCNHAFHKACINQWLERSALCPLCRTPVQTTFKVKIIGVPKSGYQRFINIGRRHCAIYDKNTVFYHLPYNIISQILISRRRRFLNENDGLSLQTTTNDDLGFKIQKVIKFRSIHADRILRMFILHFRR